MNPLQARFAAVRRRLRFVVTCRGVCWLLATLLASLAVAGLLDWLVHLPGVVRAVLLVGMLAAGGTIGYRFLLRPLSAKSDDLTLALQVEKHYPALNDCLASTVQFLEEAGDSDRSGSPALRKLAVQRGLRQAQGFDFNRIVDARGLRLAGLSLAGACALAVPLVVLFPAAAWTALVRLAHPFGSQEWPPQTQLEITAKLRLARGEPFEVRGDLRGVIPERATVTYQFEGLAPVEQTWTVIPGEQPDAGTLVARLEPDKVRRNFRFQVRANDAVKGWYDVTVLPPPSLVPLDGRPSPQVTLTPPGYTDLPPLPLPDGTGNIEAILGTRVSLRAATDRAVTRAWVEFRPDQPSVSLAAFLGPLGADSTAGALALTAAGRAVWGEVPARLSSDGKRLEVDFMPWVSGAYALRLEDDSGLGNTRLYDLRVLSDPAPAVNLERPSPSLDNLTFLPTAEVTVQVLAEDPLFAVRRVWLEYRCRKDDPPRRLPLYDHQGAGRAIPQLLSAFAARPLPPPALPLRLRLQQVQGSQRLSLASLKHMDGSALQAGDVIILQACADDFDNVAVDKKPGRSHEVELRIVRPEALEAMLDQAQAQIQQELTRLREQQREALAKVDAAEKQQRLTGKLRPEDLDNLVQAEQIQQQVRARVGAREEEGLRAEAAKALQAMRDNHLLRSSARERMELVQSELERLAREELEQIEPLLTDARKENELATQPRKPDRGNKSQLAQALRHQEEVEKTIDQLLSELVPYSTLREVKGQAKALLEEQRRLNRQPERLIEEKKIQPGAAELTPEQKAELERVAEQQRRQAEHARELLTRMERLVEEKERLVEEKLQHSKERERLAEEKKVEAARLGPQSEKAQQLQAEAQALREEAKTLQQQAQALRDEQAALREAEKVGRKGGINQRMESAARNIRENKLGAAAKEQQGSTEALQDLVKALEERREDELDRLIKKMREAEERLRQLADDQDRLQKKVKEASELADPKERERELQRLAREQEELRKKAEELGRELKRLRVQRAGHELGRADNQMREAGQQLTRDRGDEAQERQDDALDRLEEARREVQRAREQVEEELARERLAKVADQIQRLRDRQQALLDESARIHREVLQREQWTRGLLGSLSQHERAQGGLREETASLAEQKLAGATVFARILHRAVEAMEQAEERMRKRKDAALERGDQGLKLDIAAENAADEQTRKHQTTALRRLDQLLDALKPERGVAQRPAENGGGGEGQPAGRMREGDGIPALAQLKALRALQEEVNKRTEEFSRQHPDLTKLTKEQKAELESIRQDQQEVADLLEQLTQPARSEGDKP